MKDFHFAHPSQFEEWALQSNPSKSPSCSESSSSDHEVSILFLHFYLLSYIIFRHILWDETKIGYYTLPYGLHSTRPYNWVYSPLFNKVKGSDNCCSSSLHKPLVFPSVSLHFPHSAWWDDRYCAQLKFRHLFSQKIRLLLQIYTNLLNLGKHQTAAIQKKTCCLFNMQLELYDFYMDSSSTHRLFFSIPLYILTLKHWSMWFKPAGTPFAIWD